MATRLHSVRLTTEEWRWLEHLADTFTPPTAKHTRRHYANVTGLLRAIANGELSIQMPAQAEHFTEPEPQAPLPVF